MRIILKCIFKGRTEGFIWLIKVKSDCLLRAGHKPPDSIKGKEFVK